MRHTRTKQLIRLTGGKYWEYIPNVKIDEMKTLLGDYELDKSFEWHSEAVSHNYWSNHVKSMFSFEINSNHHYSAGKKRIYRRTK
jgi:hypothetical protein